MVSISERAVRWGHVAIFTLVFLASVVSLAISASLVKHYNDEGYPPAHTGAYRDRIRILLVAAVWSTAFTLILLPGFFFMGHHVAFGLLAHLVPVAIAFVLFLIGSASLTALTRPITCSNAGDAFSRCNIVKGLVIISWIDTIFIFIGLIFLTFIAFVARGGYGVRKSTLYAD